MSYYVLNTKKIDRARFKKILVSMHTLRKNCLIVKLSPLDKFRAKRRIILRRNALRSQKDG
jgi:hypothetical protein